MQARALRIASGAMPGTATAALQIMFGEMPCNIRRRKQLLEFSIKVTSTPNHSDQNMFQEHWTSAYGAYNNNRKPTALKVGDLLATMPKTWGPTYGRIEPRTLKHSHTDTELTQQPSRHL